MLTRLGTGGRLTIPGSASTGIWTIRASSCSTRPVCLLCAYTLGCATVLPEVFAVRPPSPPPPGPRRGPRIEKTTQKRSSRPPPGRGGSFTKPEALLHNLAYSPAGYVIVPRQSTQSIAMLACGIGLPMQSPRAYVDPIHKFERLSDHTLGDRLCQQHASCHGKQCGRRGQPGLLVRRCCR